MNKLLNANFKKIFIGFIIFSILIAVSAAAAGGYIFKDKIFFIYRYNKLSGDFKKSGFETQKNELTDFAFNFSDIADILVLDKDNNVIYCAKQKFANISAPELTFADPGKTYLEDKNNKDAMFYLCDNKELYLSVIADKYAKKFYRINDKSSLFFKDIQNKKIYCLSYILNKDKSEKLCFITDAVPCKNGGIYFEICEIIIASLFAAYLIIVALWTYQNAKRNNLNAPLWGIVCLFTNIIGVAIYALYKKNATVCENCRLVQSKTNIYCPRCRRKLNDVCKSCKSIINKNDNYCPHCGETLK